MNYFLLAVLCLLTGNLSALIDLDKMEQSFVLETKRIHIAGYPTAFNPSIVLWENHILMSFRFRDPINNVANCVGFIWLDKNFNPVSEPQHLYMLEDETAYTHIQDPRLFVVKNKLYMAYSDLIKVPEAKEKKRTMCLAEIIYDGNRFKAIEKEYFLDFHGLKNNKFEKNWVPFDYEGLLLLAYSISPHKIFFPVKKENKCVTIAQSSELNSWNWGELRGGTPALLIDNFYLAFFHSSILTESVQSDNKSMTHYFMGAYLFENKPPFTIKKISPHPIVSKNFYNGSSYQTWKALRVIFPCGFIYDDKHIWISYGRQDHETWIVKLDREGLLKSLIPLECNY
jgi:predicted GH43/DUF377 family glycosyl hydrolase